MVDMCKHNNISDISLLYACRHKMISLALDMLIYPDKCKLDNIDSTGATALIWTCRNNLLEVALQILKYPDRCKLGKVDKMGLTALMWACRNGMPSVAMNILNTPDKCKLDHMANGETALYLACNHNYADVALEILKYQDQYTLYHGENTISTALAWACIHKMTDVALELLKYPEKCNINKIVNFHETALSIAVRNNMHDVADILYEYVDLRKVLNLSHEKYKIIKQYIKKKFIKNIKKLPSYEDIKKRQKDITVLEAMITNLSKNGECIICYNSTNNNIFLPECKHILHICGSCACTIKNKCPICMTHGKIITGCFYI